MQQVQSERQAQRAQQDQPEQLALPGVLDQPEQLAPWAQQVRLVLQDRQERIARSQDQLAQPDQQVLTARTE